MDRQAFQERFGITGESPAIIQVIDKIGQVAPTDITVLLEGESGVGKDVTARALHGLSKRKRENLVIVNCGAIPEGIIESELFGHEKGAFTGAHESRQGYFEKADKGTIFLDEIGDTPKNVQVKLLRVLETGEFFRVGSSQLRKVDVRVIGATNKDLWKLVQSGEFREDLYYRLDTVKIKLPPLRERKEDIIPIFRRFVTEFSARHDSVFQGFSDDAKALLLSYRWPGNIRELRNVAEQLVVLERSQFVTAERLQKYLKGRQHVGSPDNLPLFVGDAGTPSTQSDFGLRDKELIYRALMELRTDVTDIKRMLGASSMYERMAPISPVPVEYKALPSAGVSWDAPSQHVGGLRTLPPSHDRTIPHENEIPYVESADELHAVLEGDAVPKLEETEKLLIERALRVYDGNRRKAAEALGISERTLYRKLDYYNLTT